MALNKQTILSMNKPRMRLVNVPQWGGDVYLRSMTGEQRDRFEEASRGGKVSEIKLTILAYSLCDEHGNRLFADAELDLLNQLDGGTLAELAVQAGELNYVTEKDIEVMQKHSEPASVPV